MLTRYRLNLLWLILCGVLSDAVAKEYFCAPRTRDQQQVCVSCRIDDNYNRVQWGLLCDNLCDYSVQVKVCYAGTDCGTDPIPPNRLNYPRAYRYRNDTNLWTGSPHPQWATVCDDDGKATSGYTASGLATGGPVALPTITPQPSPSSQPIPTPSSNPETTSVLLNGPAYKPFPSSPKEGTREYDNQRCKRLDYKTYSDCMQAVDLKWRQSLSCDWPEYRKPGVTAEECRKQVIEKYDTMIGRMEVDQAKAACSRLSDKIQRFHCVKAIERNKQHALESTQRWIDSNKDREPAPPAKEGIDKMIWDNLTNKPSPQGTIPQSNTAYPAVSKNSPGGDAHQQCYLQKSSCEQENCGGTACQQCEEQWYDCRWQE